MCRFISWMLAMVTGVLFVNGCGAGAYPQVARIDQLRQEYQEVSGAASEKEGVAKTARSEADIARGRVNAKGNELASAIMESAQALDAQAADLRSKAEAARQEAYGLNPALRGDGRPRDPLWSLPAPQASDQFQPVPNQPQAPPAPGPPPPPTAQPASAPRPQPPPAVPAFDAPPPPPPSPPLPAAKDAPAFVDYYVGGFSLTKVRRLTEYPISDWEVGVMYDRSVILRVGGHDASTLRNEPGFLPGCYRFTVTMVSAIRCPDGVVR